MGATSKVQKTINIVFRLGFLLLALPYFVVIIISLLESLFSYLSGDGSFITDLSSLIGYFLIPIVCLLLLVFSKIKSNLVILVLFVLAEALSVIQMPLQVHPLLYVIIFFVALATFLSFGAFIRLGTKYKILTIVEVLILYMLFILPANKSLNLYIIVGEAIRTITNWKLNIFYLDYQGFVVLLASVVTSLSVFLSYLIKKIPEKQ